LVLWNRSVDELTFLEQAIPWLLLQVGALPHFLKTWIGLRTRAKGELVSRIGRTLKQKPKKQTTTFTFCFTGSPFWVFQPIAHAETHTRGGWPHRGM
jgi:hypothetical protein